jgi:hypothetical protein
LLSCPSAHKAITFLWKESADFKDSISFPSWPLQKSTHGEKPPRALRGVGKLVIGVIPWQILPEMHLCQFEEDPPEYGMEIFPAP